jgi:RNA polymerase sigma factor (TIGR02999 family)
MDPSISLKAAPMTGVTRILSAIEEGDAQAAEKLLPLVYDELRNLAARKMAQENPGQTLQGTALVHEAYIRLVGKEHEQSWESRGHFFAAAAEAMRRILVERARRVSTQKRGGGAERLELQEHLAADEGRSVDLAALDDALTQLENHEPVAAELVKLRYFAGLTHQQAAQSLGISRRAADRLWKLAKAWLFAQFSED